VEVRSAAVVGIYNMACHWKIIGLESVATLPFLGRTGNESDAMKQCDGKTRDELSQEIEALRRENALLLMTQSVALRESEDRYRRMIETANEGVWILDAKGVTSFVNTKMGVMLGYHAEEMLGRHLFEFLDEEMRPAAAENLSQRKAGAKGQYDYQLRSKEGGLVWAQVCASPIYDHDRRYVGVLGMVSDITERKRAEAALADSEAHYRAMINAFDGMMYICSPDYRIEFLNDRLKLRTGYDATGELCYRALHGLEAVCPWCVNERVFSGECVRWEVQSPKDKRWYEVSNSPIYNLDGSVSKQAMITDVTQRKRAEIDILKQKVILSQAAKLARFGAWEWDAASDMFTVSEEWAKMHGSEVTVISRESWVSLSHPEDRPKIRQAFRDALDGPGVYQVDYRIVKSEDGSLRCHHSLGEVVRDAELKPVGMFGVVQDITQG